MANKGKKLTPNVKPVFLAAEIERALRNFYVELNSYFTKVGRHQMAIFVPTFLTRLDEFSLLIAEACEYSSHLDPKKRVDLLNKAIAMKHLIISRLTAMGKFPDADPKQINRLSIELQSLNELLHSFRAYTDQRFAKTKSKTEKDKNEP